MQHKNLVLTTSALVHCIHLPTCFLPRSPLISCECASCKRSFASSAKQIKILHVTIPFLIAKYLNFFHSGPSCMSSSALRSHLACTWNCLVIVRSSIKPFLRLRQFIPMMNKIGEKAFLDSCFKVLQRLCSFSSYWIRWLLDVLQASRVTWYPTLLNWQVNVPVHRVAYFSFGSFNNKLSH